jgi:hypothetical protein
VDLRFRFPPNWTGIVFFGVMGGLHYVNALPGLFNGRFDGHLSLLLACAFTVVTFALYVMRAELAVRPSHGDLRQRFWLFRTWYDREILFERVQAVRVYVPEAKGEGRVEIVCDDETLELPPTRIPRQEALHLAMSMNVPLIKVMDEADAREPRAVTEDVKRET